MRVTVATGKVAVSHSEKLLNILLPGKQISVQSTTGAFTESTVPVWHGLFMEGNRITTNQCPFAELQLAMQSMYGIELQTNSGEVKARHYNIKLNRNTPVQEVIKVLALLNQHQYKRMTNTSWLLY